MSYRSSEISGSITTPFDLIIGSVGNFRGTVRHNYTERACANVCGSVRETNWAFVMFTRGKFYRQGR